MHSTLAKRRPYTAAGLLPMLLILLGVATSAPGNAQLSLGVNRVLQVSSAGTNEQNCQGLRDTLAGIADASFTKPYLIRLEPGTYDCGSTTVFLFEGMAIEGSGVDLTILRGAVDNPILGVLHINGSKVALRNIGVFNTWDSGTEGGTAIAVSIFEIGTGPGPTSVELRAVQLGAADYSISITEGAPIVWSSSVGSIRNDGGNLFLRNSRVGTVQTNGGQTRCVFCSDGSGNPLDQNCM